MVARAILRYGRMSARKARLVIDLIRGKPVNQALAILAGTNKRAVTPVRRLLLSAVANAHVRDAAYHEGNLYISRLVADEGPMLKRHRAAPMGRAMMIRRRTVHLTVELEAKGKPKA